MRETALKRLIITCFMALLLTASVAVDASGKKGLPGADARKADYIFLEALKMRGTDRLDAYYSLVDAAHMLNPSDKFLAKEHASGFLALNQNTPLDSPEVKNAVDLFVDYVWNNPTDVTSGLMLAHIAANYSLIDTTLTTWRKVVDANPGRVDLSLGYVKALCADTAESSHRLAFAILDTLEAREGLSPELIVPRMQLLLEKSDTVGMKNQAMRLLASNPSNPAYLSFIGNLMMDFGDRDSALVYFNRSVEADPSSAAAYLDRAHYYSQLGDSAAYDREIFRAMSVPDLDVEPKLEILRDYVINLYQDTLQRPRIATLFQQLIDMYPHEPQVRGLYADYLIAVNDYAGAAEQKEYQLDLNPSGEKDWVALGALYLQTENYPKAETATRRGLHYFPENARLYEYSAMTLQMQDRDKEAVEMLRRGMAVADSTDAELMSDLYAQAGALFQKMELNDSIRNYYDRAIAYNGMNLSALNNYAYFLACQDQDLDKALTYIERVMDVNNEDPTSLDTYAWVLFKRKDFEKAKEIIDSAVSLIDEPSAEIFSHAGDIYFMAGEPDKALHFWQKALKLDPADALLRKKVKHKTFFYK